MNKEIAYVVCDLETTGLYPQNDVILEIAAIAVTADLEEVSRFHQVLTFGAAGIARVSPEVVYMHTSNGLWEECALSAISEFSADTDFALFLNECTQGQAILLGNSVHFDLGFLKARMPYSAVYLSHRVADISGMARFLRESCGIVAEARSLSKSDHRAMADAEGSLETARAIRSLLTARTSIRPTEGLPPLLSVDQAGTVAVVPEGVSPSAKTATGLEPVSLAADLEQV